MSRNFMIERIKTMLETAADDLVEMIYWLLVQK